MYNVGIIQVKKGKIETINRKQALEDDAIIAVGFEKLVGWVVGEAVTRRRETVSGSGPVNGDISTGCVIDHHPDAPKHKA
jgi:hypothetical protein